MADERTVLITGRGRSGSHRVLDILDCSEDTLCRNELNKLEGGALAALPNGFFLGDQGEGFPALWREARDRAARSFGARDHLGVRPKAYLADWQRERVAPILAKRSARRALSALAPKLRAEEWPAGPLYGGKDVERAVPVFKALMCQGWADAILPADPYFFVVHNMRRPDDFLRSWWERYVLAHGPEKVWADSLETIGRVLEAFGEAPGRFTDYSDAGLVETEVWRWRYVNEFLFERYADHPRYAVVTFQEASDDPVALARRLYAMVGLGFGDAEEARVEALRNTKFKPRAKVSPLPDGVIEDAIGRATEGSALTRIPGLLDAA